MYKVKNDLSIVRGNVEVLAVTSAHYAEYLCNQLNSGVTVAEINSRSYPDKEYFSYCREVSREAVLSA